MATLLSIVQDAVRDVGNHLVPSAVVGSSDETAEICLSHVNRLGRELARGHDWETLLAEHTFPTVASTASYALPTDYRKFARFTFWDRGQSEPLSGPVSPWEWQTFQSADVYATTRTHFRIQGGSIHLYPTPSSVFTVAFDYYSTNWCTSAAAVGQSKFAADDDILLLDEELLILGLKARFLRSRGEPYDEPMLDYTNCLNNLLAIDNGPQTIEFGGRFTGFPVNLPDTGYGS